MHSASSSMYTAAPYHEGSRKACLVKSSNCCTETFRAELVLFDPKFLLHPEGLTASDVPSLRRTRLVREGTSAYRSS